MSRRTWSQWTRSYRRSHHLLLRHSEILGVIIVMTCVHMEPMPVNNNGMRILDEFDLIVASASMRQWTLEKSGSHCISLCMVFQSQTQQKHNQHTPQKFRNKANRIHL